MYQVVATTIPQDRLQCANLVDLLVHLQEQHNYKRVIVDLENEKVIEI